MEVTSALTAARPELPKKISPKEPKNHDLGYSRGGCGTKIHLVCDANGNYMNAVLSAGQEHETQHFETLVSSISIPNPSKRRPRRICGDKGCSSETI
ncbi:MAG: transposase [Planctomycetia bacterium]|nr:transposase [Planctomycetia bacterium]